MLIYNVIILLMIQNFIQGVSKIKSVGRTLFNLLNY